MKSELENEVITLISNARAAKSESDAAELALKSRLAAVINALVPLGTKFNRIEKGRPPYLFRIKTVRGNDRNTNTFVVAGHLSVDVNVAHPGLSTWACEATPISEKTDKPMNGSSHGADGSGQATVRIKGEFDPSWDMEEVENQRLLMVVAKAAELLPIQSRAMVAVLDTPGLTNTELISALAECRDAFPAPAPGHQAENAWASAMASPLNIPAYIVEMASTIALQAGSTAPEAAKLTSHEKTELLDWLSACQSAYHIENTPNHRFGGIPGALGENRDSLVEYVQNLMDSRAELASSLMTPKPEQSTLLRGRSAGFEPVTHVDNEEANKIVGRLRMACLNVRIKSAPLSDLIPLMQQAADALEAASRTPVVEAVKAETVSQDEIRSLAKFMCEIQGVNPDEVLDIRTDGERRFAWHREDLRAARWLDKFLSTRTDPTTTAQLAEPQSKLDRFLEMVRHYIANEGGDMDAMLTWMYADQIAPATGTASGVPAALLEVGQAAEKMGDETSHAAHLVCDDFAIPPGDLMGRLSVLHIRAPSHAAAIDDAKSAERYRLAIAKCDNAETLYAAVLNNGTDVAAINQEFDAAMLDSGESDRPAAGAVLWQ